MTNTERQAVRDLLAAAKRVGGDELKQKVWELLLIRKQIETNVRDGFCGPGTLDVVINDEWETLPCTYKDGMFTVTRGPRLGQRAEVLARFAHQGWRMA